jgi:hypothetical protein
MNERRGFNEKDYGLSSYLAENMFSHFPFLTLFCVLADLHVIRWDFLVNYVIKLFGTIFTMIREFFDTFFVDLNGISCK